jgi:putative FmdB family regulatory protein
LPLFEYKCGKCENKFETLVLNSDEKTSCPKCGSAKLEKLFSSFGFKSAYSIPVSSTSEVSASTGCGCTPINCGCSIKH